MSKRALWALGAALALAGCGGGKAPTSDYRAPAGTPVVLISIDTLRADHLPAYGYQKIETPAIDRLRRDGILYEQAFSHTPLTLPSHTSMLSGLLPAVHGVRDNTGYLVDRERVLAGSLPFLPQLLHQAGYATGGAVSTFVLRAKTGISTGFDFYEDSIEFRTNTGLGGLQRPGRTTLALARDWLDSAAAKPFFFFFHLYDPHTPYQPPEPFASRYPLAYDGEIAEADAVVGELIAQLERLGIYDKALIVLVSDHGEGLGDHGEDEHGILLYRESIHVPLIVKLPARQGAGGTVAAPAGLIDLAPTVLSVLGLPVPAAMTGHSLLALAGADVAPREIYSETFYPRLHFGWSDLASLIDAGHHYIEGPDPELYDLAADPGERTNVLQSQRRVSFTLRQALASYDRELKPPGEVDAETQQALSALGYLGGHQALGDGPLLDPKTQVGTISELRKGMALHAKKDDRGAVAALRGLLQKNPRLVDAWEFLGRSLDRLGESDEALAAYREALKVSGGSPQIALAAASLYFELGRLDEAEEHARLAVSAHSSFAHGLLAQIALERQDLNTAENEAREAMKGDENRLGPMITLAEIQQRRGKLDEALAAIEKVEAAYAQRKAKDQDLIRGLNLLRGKILADQTKAAEAEAAFEKEIALFPDNLRAYSSLAILKALSGRPAEVGATLKRMVDVNPSPRAYAEAVKALRILKDERGARGLLQHARGLFPKDSGLRALG